MAQVSNRAEYLRKALSNFNMRSVAGKHLGEVTVHHPGITYSDLSTNSRNPCPSVPNIQRLIEGIRFFAHHMPVENSQDAFLDYDELTKDRFTFIASTEFHISPLMYDFLQPKAPLEAKLQLNHVGSAALSTNCRILCANSRKELVHNTNGVISVDKNTRTPLQLPESWVNKYKPLANTDVAFRVLRNKHPQNCVKETTQIRWTDTDIYQHSNWTSYIKYCFDAIILHADAGIFKTPAATISNCMVKFATLAYINESILGDNLDVNMWETGVNQLEFDITRENKPLCYCRIEYYNPDELYNQNTF